jgi:hypothetical protein
MTVNNECVIRYSAGSSPSEAHSGGWEGVGKDGEEPSPHLSMRSDVSIIIEREVITYQALSRKAKYNIVNIEIIINDNGRNCFIYRLIDVLDPSTFLRIQNESVGEEAGRKFPERSIRKQETFGAKK